jgi:hypothetical protein
MATFNPTQSVSSGAAEDKRAEVNQDLPGGDYLLRIVWFKREVSKAGNEYLRLKAEVLSGPHTNSAFFTNLQCKIEMAPVAIRWKGLCRALGITDSFEIGGREGDADFLRLFKDKPFKAQIARTISGEYVNFDLQGFYTRDKWTENDVEAVRALVETMTSAADDDDIPF